MIAVVWLTVRARWVRALACAVLAAFTVAVAAAMPAYEARADAAMIANEIAHASVAERSISASAVFTADDHGAGAAVFRAQPTDAAGHAKPNGASVTAAPADTVARFATVETASLHADWLQTVYAIDIDVDTAPVAPLSSDTATIPQVVFREGYCDHVVIVAGRCPIATREVLLDGSLARRLHVTVGDALPLYQVLFTVDGWRPTKAYGVTSVVGIYRVVDEHDPYWGTQRYFSAASGEHGSVLPILTQPDTIAVIPHANERAYVDAFLRPAALTSAVLPTVEARVRALTRPDSAPVAPGSDSTTVVSAIPTLLDRIDADRATLRTFAPGLAIPLIAIGCFALFLVAAHAAAARRPEFAVALLRGLPQRDRWWIAAGESLAPVLVGGLLGWLAGSLLARGMAALTLRSMPDGVADGSTGGTIAAVTLGVAAISTLAGVARPLFAPVTDLLRRVPARVRGLSAAPLPTAIVVLGVAALVQLRAQSGMPSGLTVITPAALITAVAVLLGFLVPPIAALVGSRTIGTRDRRGDRPARLGVGIAALSLARRPGAQRMFVIEALVIGLLGYAVALSVSAATTRAAFVRTELGAPRVVTVAATSAERLLHKVRAADPSGRYAMAAMAIPQAKSSDPPLLAVDSARLGSVALATPGEDLYGLAAALRVTEPTPVTVSGGRIGADVTSSWPSSPPPQVDLTVTLLPADDSPLIFADLGTLDAGRHTYTSAMPGCARGCRVVSLGLEQRGGTTGAIAVTVHRVLTARQTFPGPMTPEPGGAVPLHDATKWRSVSGTAGPSPVRVAGGASGLTVSVSDIGDVSGGAVVTPVAAALPLPVMTAGWAVPSSVAGVDTIGVGVRVAATAHALPRVAARGGALVDLDALALAAARPGTELPGEVWLARGTPAGVVAALSDQGLRPLTDRTASAERAYLAAQGPAVGIAFDIAAVAAVLTVAIACLLLLLGVDRSSRVAELRALRLQGLRAGTARTALRIGQLGVVAAAGAAGVIAAAAAWLATADRMPMFVQRDGPRLDALAVPIVPLTGGCAAALVLLAVATVVGTRYRERGRDAAHTGGSYVTDKGTR